MNIEEWIGWTIIIGYKKSIKVSPNFTISQNYRLNIYAPPDAKSAFYTGLNEEEGTIMARCYST